MIQAEGVGTVYGDESQEYHGQHETFCVMYPQNGTTIDITVTSASDTMSVDNTEDVLVSTRAPIDTDKPYYKPATSASNF